MHEDTPLSTKQEARARIVRRTGLLILLAIILWTVVATIVGVFSSIRDDNHGEPIPVTRLAPP